ARRAVVPFEPAPVVRMYTCGITPYDATPLGPPATVMLSAILQRRPPAPGPGTLCVPNITDVDDPLLVKASELGIHYLDLAAAEVARFDDHMEALGQLPTYSAPGAKSAR